MPVQHKPQPIVNVVEGKVFKGSKGCCSVTWKWCSSTWKLVLSEFVSTTILLLVGCMASIPIDNLPPQPIYGALGFGFVVMFNIQIFGHLSGAHMNPSVSLAAAIFGKISSVTAVAYVLAQCAGAILGYGILIYLAPMDIAAGGVCVTQVHERLGMWQALGIEIALTSTLNFINCSVWDPVNKDKVESTPIKFGLAIAGLSLAGGPLTGASMNPARSLGPALISGIWTDFWIYCVGPIVAGVLPTMFYKYIWLTGDETKVETLEQDRSEKISDFNVSYI